MVLGALLFLFEEVLWAALGRLMARLAHLPLLARLEAALRGLPPYPAMAVFLLPVGLVLPINLAAAWLLAQGHSLAGILCLVTAKLSGMALWARLYSLCGPALRRLAWFARGETLLFRWSAWAHDWLAGFPAWVRARRLAAAALHRARCLLHAPDSWLSHRLAAARRLSRSYFR
jgi:hypothetical protein